MSRIGKKPVDLPKGVKASVADGVISVEGPKGKLSFNHRPEIRVAADETRVSIDVDESLIGDRKISALWGTTRALVQNMVTGVTTGYERKLKIVGVGWNAQVAGTALKLNVGYANQLSAAIPTGVNVAVEKDIITVSGADKHAVGQFCATVHGMRKPEPYNGKGIHYAERPMKKKEGKKVK